MRHLLFIAACSVCAAAAAQGDGTTPAQARQELVRQALDLNADLRVAEERALYPADTQIDVFLAMDLGIFFELNSVKLEIDGKPVAEEHYSPDQADALVQGGTPKLYIGNLQPGQHELVAVFTGKGPHYRIRRAVQLDFDKQPGTQMVELRITDSDKRQEPAFIARVVQ